MVISDLKKEIVDYINLIVSEIEKSKEIENLIFNEFQAKKKKADSLKQTLQKYLEATENIDTFYTQNLANQYVNATRDQLSIANILNKVHNRNKTFIPESKKIIDEYKSIIENRIKKEEIQNSAELLKEKFKNIKYENFFDINKEKNYVYKKRRDVERKIVEVENNIDKLNKEIFNLEQKISLKESEKEDVNLSEDEIKGIESEIKQYTNQIKELKKSIVDNLKKLKKYEISYNQMLAQEKVLSSIDNVRKSNSRVTLTENEDIQSLLSSTTILKKQLDEYDHEVENQISVYDIEEGNIKLDALASFFADNLDVKNKLLSLKSDEAKKSNSSQNYENEFAGNKNDNNKNDNVDTNQEYKNTSETNIEENNSLQILQNEEGLNDLEKKDVVVANNVSSETSVEKNDNELLKSDNKDLVDTLFADKYENQGENLQNESSLDVNENIENLAQTENNKILSEKKTDYNTALNTTSENEKNDEAKVLQSEQIVLQLNEDKQIAPLMPELFDNTMMKNYPEERLFLAKKILEDKLQNEKLKLQVLKQARDAGSIITENEKINNDIENLEKQITLDSILLHQTDAYLKTKKQELTEKELKNPDPIVERKVVSDYVISQVNKSSMLNDAERQYFYDEISKTDSLLDKMPNDISLLKKFSLLNNALLENLSYRLDSILMNDTLNGKAKFIVASAKAMFDLAMNMEEEKNEKNKDEKINKLKTSLLLKQLAVKSLYNAENVIRSSDNSKLFIPLLTVKNNEEIEELKQNLAKITTTNNFLSVFESELTNLSNKLMVDTLLTSKEVKKIEKKISEIKKKQKLQYQKALEAYNNVFTINEKFLTQLVNEYPVSNPEEFTAYINSANEMFNKAVSSKIQAEEEQDENKKLKLLNETYNYYKQALRLQNIALNNVLFGISFLPTLSVSNNDAVSPLLIASELSLEQINLPTLDKNKLVDENYGLDDKDNWFYAFENDKEIKEMIETLKEVEDEINKNRYEIKQSNNKARIENAKSDLKYLEKKRKQIISDLTSFVVENEELKQNLLDKKIVEKKKNSTLTADEQRIINVLRLKSTNYNDRAKKIFNEVLSRVDNDEIKTKLLLVAKKYKELATKAKMQELAILSGTANKELLAEVLNKQTKTDALKFYSENNINVVSNEQKNEVTDLNGEKNKVIFRKPTENFESNVTIPTSSIMVNMTKNMISGQSYPISIIIDTTAYASLAKLKVSYPGYVNVQINDYPSLADMIRTDTSINFIWLKYYGKNPQNVSLTIEPKNVLSYTDTISIEFSYLKNEKIEKIIKKYSIKFDAQQIVAENTKLNSFLESSQRVNTNSNNVELSDTETKTELNTEKQEGQKTTINQQQNNVLVNEASIRNTEVIPFVVLNESFYNSNNPIPINPPLPEGIIYKIQIGAFFRLVPDTLFKVKPISIEKKEGSRYYKYLFGQFMTYDGALAALNKIRLLGYKNAFIVAYKNGERILVYAARKEQRLNQNYNILSQTEIAAINNSSSYNPNSVKSIENNNVELESLSTLPSDRKLYTVQIGVFKNRPNQAFLNAFDDIYYEKTNYGFTRYFTGIFDTYSKAIERKQYAVSRGIRDAFIVFYDSGKRQLSNIRNAIDVEQQTEAEIEVDNIIDTAGVYYSVQIGAFKRTVSLEDIAKGISAIRNYEVSFLKSGGYTIFVAGRFKSIEKARSLANIIKNEGIRDAFVIAIKNGRKIPVQQVIRTGR